MPLGEVVDVVVAIVCQGWDSEPGIESTLAHAGGIVERLLGPYRVERGRLSLMARRTEHPSVDAEGILACRCCWPAAVFHQSLYTFLSEVSRMNVLHTVRLAGKDVVQRRGLVPCRLGPSPAMPSWPEGLQVGIESHKRLAQFREA